MIEASVHGVGSNPWMGSNKAVGRAGSITQAILKQSAFINNEFFARLLNFTFCRLNFCQLKMLLFKYFEPAWQICSEFDASNT